MGHEMDINTAMFSYQANVQQNQSEGLIAQSELWVTIGLYDSGTDTGLAAEAWAFGILNKGLTVDKKDQLKSNELWCENMCDLV